MREIEVKPLELGRKNKAKKKRLRQEHGTLILAIPKKFVEDLGLKLGQEVTVKKQETNPLNWELVIKKC